MDRINDGNILNSDVQIFKTDMFKRFVQPAVNMLMNVTSSNI